ncbi:MAG TPA: YetF domain-containing protein, partial [Pirellulales bacterium]
SNTVQNAIIGEDNSVSGGVIGATTLLGVNYFVVRFLYNHEKFSHIIEGDADKLIENGRLFEDRLKKELLTLSELEIAAHKQGFASLDEVETATLETGGVISFVGKKPDPDEKRYLELSRRMDAMNRKLDELKAALASRG